VRDFPLPLALTARLSPVAVLATAGWVLTSGPSATPAAAEHQSGQSAASQSASAPSQAPEAKKYATAPAPCGSVAVPTVKSLVPGANTAGKEIPATDKKLRRTCSWNALSGYNYRWLDVSFEITDSNASAQAAYKKRVAEKSGGGDVPGLGDGGYSVVDLTTQDKQQTREGTVVAQVSNALVVVTYNGSNFDTKKAPSTDEINKGAIKAAKSAVTALSSGQQS
jgi:hypothetical protein